MTYTPCPDCSGAILGDPDGPCPNQSCRNSIRGRVSAGPRLADLSTIERPSGLIVPRAPAKPNREERRGKPRRKRSRK